MSRLLGLPRERRYRTIYFVMEAERPAPLNPRRLHQDGNRRDFRSVRTHSPYINLLPQMEKIFDELAWTSPQHVSSLLRTNSQLHKETKTP
jgi:hypothetical protein